MQKAIPGHTSLNIFERISELYRQYTYSTYISSHFQLDRSIILIAGVVIFLPCKGMKNNREATPMIDDTPTSITWYIMYVRIIVSKGPSHR